MKALVCNSFEGLAGLDYQDMDEPDLLPGHVRVRIKAAGLNFADTLIIKGEYQEKPELPFIPGLEACGEVIEAGDGAGYPPGTRVAFVQSSGAFAEEAVVPAEACVPVPDDMDDETAAGFLVTYGTSHVALDHRGGLKEGETLLVHGAAGGVGLAAVEIGKRMGATVIGTAGAPHKLEIAREHGADHMINYREENFREHVMEITNGKGVDVVYDPVGGDVFDSSLRCLAWEGRLLTIGFASGRIPEAKANYLLVKNTSVVGVHWGAYMRKSPGVVVASLQTLFGWYAEGVLNPHVSETFPLNEGAEAMKALLSRRTTGKVVLTVES